MRRRGVGWLLGLTLAMASTPAVAWPGRSGTGPSQPAASQCAPDKKAPTKKAAAKKPPAKKPAAKKAPAQKSGKASRKPPKESPPEPVLSVGEAGVVDYSRGEVRALGVGTPEILSPTGDITRRDLYETALDDASRRLGQTLGRVRLGPGRGAAALQARLKPPAPTLLQALELGEARFFTDGTVHAPVRLGLTAWLAAAEGPQAAAPGAPARPSGSALRFVGPPIPHAIAARLDPMPVTGVVLALSTPSRATLGVRLSGGDGAPLDAGLPGDPVAGEGLRWFRAGDPALAAWVGPAPLSLAVAASAPGTFILTDAAAELATLPDLGDLPVAVVVPR